MSKRAIIVTLAMLLLLPGIAVAGFTDNGNGTVTDTTTNLMWQQCSAGQSGAGCATGTAGTYTWDNAISYCEGLSFVGFTDWRLPNIKELLSIADSTKASAPAINSVYFPATRSGWYMSSTTNVWEATTAWYVYFGDGIMAFSNKTLTNYVRCVR